MKKILLFLLVFVFLIFDITISYAKNTNISASEKTIFGMDSSENGLAQYASGVKLKPFFELVISRALNTSTGTSGTPTVGVSTYLGTIPRFILTGMVLYGISDQQETSDYLKGNIKNLQNAAQAKHKVNTSFEQRGTDRGGTPQQVFEATFRSISADIVTRTNAYVNVLNTLNLNNLWNTILYVCTGTMMILLILRSSVAFYYSVIGKKDEKFNNIAQKIPALAIFTLIILIFLKPICMTAIEISAVIADVIEGFSFIDTPELINEKSMSKIGIMVEAKYNMIVKPDGLFNWLGIPELIATFASYIGIGVLWAMYILIDVVCAVTLVMAPIVITGSLIPGCEDWQKKWVKSFTAILFWLPLMSLVCIFMLFIANSFSVAGIVPFFILCFVMILTLINLPEISRDFSLKGLGGVIQTVIESPAKMASSAAGKIIGRFM